MHFLLSVVYPEGQVSTHLDPSRLPVLHEVHWSTDATQVLQGVLHCWQIKLTETHPASHLFTHCALDSKGKSLDCTQEVQLVEVPPHVRQFESHF